ncbi:MAG: phage major capsid protein, partial [Thermoanaerobaculia bacterium]
MANINDYRMRAHALAEELRSINAKATTEERDFKASESRRVAEIQSEADELRLKIANEERGRDIERRLVAEYAGGSLAAGRNTRTTSDAFTAAFVREVRSQYLGRDVGDPRGDVEERVLVGLTGSGDSFTDAGYAPRVLDFLAANSVVLKSGVTLIRTDKESVILPHLTSDVTAANYAQNATITSTDAGAETLTAVPRKYASLSTVSNELLRDGQHWDALGVLGRSGVRSVALSIDLACIEGAGTGTLIKGMKSVSGITSITQSGDTANGLTPASLDFIADAVAA